MSSNEQKFKYDSNYKKEASFTHIKFGHDLPVLETELNEAQILQEKARTSLTRHLVPSGFIELVSKEFEGPSLLYNPSENGLTKLNHIAIAPSKAIVNGYELTLEGNFLYNQYSNYILVDLGEAPDDNNREDLVYLEVWFQILTGADNVQEHGYSKGNYIGYQIIDPRVNEETTRRIALYWDIRVEKGVDFNQYPDGFGYINSMNNSKIYGIANGSLSPTTSLIFMNATNDVYKDCEFYKDPNLYVAGRPNDLAASSSIYGGYVFAMPLFKVIRRNKDPYSIGNFNGAISLNDINNTQLYNSVINGDLANNIRPDKLYYDYIDQRDLLDLRHIINVKEFKQHYYLDKTIKDLLNGQLQTKEKNKMRRVQFGTTDIDYTNDSRIQFNSKFNGNLTPFVREQTNPLVVHDNDNIIYKDSLNGYGLYLDGTNYVKYCLYNNIDVNKGTIDFYFQPYWYGPDETNQTIFTLIDATNNPIFTFEKKGKYLIWTQYFDVISENNSDKNSIQVDLTNSFTSTLSLMAKNIYHIRLSWSSDESVLSSYIYINGRLVGPGLYQENKLQNKNPYWLQLGKIESLNNTGFVIENLTIYNSTFEFAQGGYWPNLPKDFIYGDSLLLPSFNSNLSNFSDNGYTQTTTKLLLANGGSAEETRTFIFNIPEGETIDETSLVTKDVSTNEIINGTWENIDGGKKFTTVENVTQILLQYKKIVNNPESTILNISDDPINWESIFIFTIPAGETIDNNSLIVYDVIDGGLVNGVWSDVETNKQFIAYGNINQILLQYKTVVNIPYTTESLPADQNSIEGISKFTFELPNGQTIDDSSIIVKDDTNTTIIPGSWVTIDNDTRQFIAIGDIPSIKITYTIISQDKTTIINKTGNSTSEKIFIFELPSNKIIDDLSLVVKDTVIGNTIDGTWTNINETSKQFTTIVDGVTQVQVDYNVIREIIEITLDLNGDLSGKFLFNIPYGKSIDNDSLIVYNTSNGNIVTGVWEDISTNTKKFVTTESINQILIQYDLIIPPGNGGYDLPNEIIAASVVSLGINGNSDIQEISYCRKDSNKIRQIEYIQPRKINGTDDKAYDYPLTYDDSNVTIFKNIKINERCFARLLNYYISGNGTNVYTIPSVLYGYEVIGIIEVINRKLICCTKLDNGSFRIELKKEVLDGEMIEFKLALGGITFEYETQTKTLVNNIHKTKILQFTANGIDDEYIIPAFELTGCGGIIKAALTFIDNEVDIDGNLNGIQTKYKVYFINKGESNDMYLPTYSENPNDPSNPLKTGYKIAAYELQQTADSFGTPFLKIKLLDKPSYGDIIQIPVLVSYQPPENVNLSIWYNYIPYQGVLSNNIKQLKRLTDWKYFITTLSSGNINYIIDRENVYSLNNVVNRLPGGMAYAYKVTGESVAFQYVSNTFANANINHQLAFVNDVFFANKNGSLDSTTFSLETDFNVYKSAKGFQDGKLVIQNQDFSIFLPECALDIAKYIGMACLVVDENGELMLFVVGNLDQELSKVNELIPKYGDLFRINGIPTTIKEVF